MKSLALLLACLVAGIAAQSSDNPNNFTLPAGFNAGAVSDSVKSESVVLL